MATIDSTGAGRSSTGSGNSSCGFGNGILNESIALDPNDLLAMLAGDDSDGEECAHNENGEQDCAIRTDLDGMFAGATDPPGRAEIESELKRKRGSEGVHVCGCVWASLLSLLLSYMLRSKQSAGRPVGYVPALCAYLRARSYRSC